MSVIDRIAYYQNRRDEVPNQELARAFAAKQDRKGIAEIALHLWDDNPNVRSDCLKVLYEIGEIQPALIADYAPDFLKLLDDRNNRLVWGAMTALASVASLKPDLLYAHRADLERITDSGSVITQDYGIKTLALVAASSAARRNQIFPYLLRHLATCRPKDVAQRAEKIVVAVALSNRDSFVKVLEQRLSDLTPSQAARVRKALKSVA